MIVSQLEAVHRIGLILGTCTFGFVAKLRQHTSAITGPIFLGQRLNRLVGIGRLALRLAFALTGGVWIFINLFFIYLCFIFLFLFNFFIFVVYILSVVGLLHYAYHLFEFFGNGLAELQILNSVKLLHEEQLRIGEHIALAIEVADALIRR